MMTLQEEYEAALKEGAATWRHLSREFRQQHKEEKHAKDGDLYWFALNRAADARARALASVLRVPYKKL